MKFSRVHQMLAAGATPQTGSELSNEQAICLAENEFPLTSSPSLSLTLAAHRAMKWTPPS